MKKNELTYKDLKNSCNPNIFTFETTAELDNEGLVYGQERGISALQFGISMTAKGYNLYIEGPSGVGKTMYSKQYVSEIASKQKTPNDWCYIYNFNNPNEQKYNIDTDENYESLEDNTDWCYGIDEYHLKKLINLQ